MFSGALLFLIDSLCVYPRLFFDGLFRETSFAAGKRPVHPRTFDLTYNRESRHLIIILLLLPKEERRLITNQPDSARFSRISKILPNQQDSLKSARLPLSRFQPRNPADTRPRLPSIEPSPSTATHSLGSRPCRLIRHQGTSRALSGLWAIDRAGPRPFLLTVV